MDEWAVCLPRLALLEREKGGENFAGFSEEGLVEEVPVSGRFGADVKRFGATLGVCGKTCRGLDGAGSADGKKNSAVIESEKNTIEFEGSFPEPADVRADGSATGAARKFEGRLVEGRIVERRAGAGIATALEKFTMHVNDAAGAGLLVEIVDVLGAEEKTIREGAFQSGESEMPGIRFGGSSNAATHGIEIPDEARIAAPGVRGGDVF